MEGKEIIDEYIKKNYTFKLDMNRLNYRVATLSPMQ